MKKLSKNKEKKNREFCEKIIEKNTDDDFDGLKRLEKWKIGRRNFC